MQCRQFEDRWNELLDERLSPESDNQLVDHARVCEPCRQLLVGQAVLFAGLEHWETPALENGFEQRVLSASGFAAIASLPTQRSSGRRKWWVAGGLIATAAGVLLLVTLQLRDRANNTTQPTAVHQTGGSSPQPGALAVTNVGPGKRAPAKSLPTLANSAPKPVPVVEHTHSKDYLEYQRAFHSLAAQIPDPYQTFDHVEETTPGVRPIRSSFSVAIGTLRRTIPQRRPNPASKPVKPDMGFCPQVLELTV